MDNLKYRQALPLSQKIAHSKQRIEDWYFHFGGKVYVSFSGGKDSTVLLHLVRSMFPEVEAVFCDTGLEFPEIRSFVKSVDNVTWLRPTMPFNQVLKKHGWPIVSKEQARYIQDVRESTPHMKKLRLTGERKDGTVGKMGILSKKWRYLVNAPFKISNSCCNVMKKSPFKKFERESGKVPYIGTMAGESSLRLQKYNRDGCNSFNTKRKSSSPLSFWTEKDVWEYMDQFGVPYSNIYDMGYDRTGCIFCLFGHHLDIKRGVNRVANLQKTHPKLYDYCMGELGMKEVLEWYDMGGL